MKIKVFLFHRVVPEMDVLWQPMYPERFNEIVGYLNKNYQIVSLEDTLLNGEKSTGEKSLAAIVFDDGYKDFINYSLPILKKYHAPSSMYIVTDCVETGLPPWTYVLDYLFTNTNILANPAVDLLEGEFKIAKWSNAVERMAYAGKLKPYLKKISDSKRRAIYDSYKQAFNDVQLPQGLIMNWREIKTVAAEGVTIGSHSHSHPLLGKIEEEEILLNELELSYRLIEEKLGFAPITISYPIGSYSDKVKSVAKEAGYKIGLAVNQKPYDSTVQDIFEVPRIELYNEGMLKTKLRISGHFENLKNLLGR